MRVRSYIGALTLAVVTPVAAQAAIIVPTYVSGTDVNSDTSLGFDPSNTTTDGGLSMPVSQGASLATAQAATFGATDFSQFWETVSSGGNYFDNNPPPSLVFDLGHTATLANLVMWESFGGNDNQLATFTVSYGTDGVTFVPTSTFTLNEIVANMPTPAQTFALGGISARYVELTLTSNHYGEIGVGGDRVGFGKIRFDAAAAVPEAPTWAMLIAGFGLAGAALRRRRAVAA